MISPLDWPTFVQEAIARRKAEKLTQRELAGLAGVSPPTITSFERGELTLRLESAFAILSVLGLVERVAPATGLEGFIHACQRRFAELTAGLPDDAWARQPRGYYEAAYAFEPGAEVTLGDLMASLRRVGEGDTGWPPFWVPTRRGLRPMTRDGGVECWLGNPTVELTFGDAAHSDFWRVEPVGRAYLRRGYQEDSDTQDPGVVFDLTLPIWRTAELLRHAARLATALNRPHAKITLRVRYAGLTGRELIAWSSPRRRSFVPGTRRADADHAQCILTTTVGAIGEDLGRIVQQLLAPLYAKFDGFELSDTLVREEVSSFLAAAEQRHHDLLRRRVRQSVRPAARDGHVRTSEQ